MVTTAGRISRERVPAEASHVPGIGLRVGQRRPVDLIERIDHDSVSTVEILELVRGLDAGDIAGHHPLHHESDL